MCLVSFSKTDNYSALKKVEYRSQPAWAYFHICDDCSHKCPWCYGEFNLNRSSLMSLEDFKTITAKLKQIGTLQITLSGGEPTEHPQFREFVKHAAANGFMIHIASHGEHIDEEVAGFLAAQNVAQVQFNWQGSRYHDRMHGVKGAYEKAVKAVGYVLAEGIEATTTITVGKYNLPHIEEIMGEAVALGVSRLRVWESTGVGNAWRKGLEAVHIFERCREVAAGFGYNHTLSYDPLFQGDVTVPCIQFSNLTMCIESTGKLVFCKAVPDNFEMTDLLDPSLDGPAIREIYLRKNREALAGREPFCPAREGFDRKAASEAPVVWHSQVGI